MLTVNIGDNIGLLMMVVFPIAMYGFLLIDKLIRRLYETFYEEWVRVGKPSGLLYFPPDSKNIQSMIAFQINIFVWFFKTPQWIKDDSLSLSYLRKIRLSLALGNILMLLGVIALVLSLKQ
jgi:hypothetical protein